MKRRANVGILANHSGNSKIKTFAQELVKLNQELDKKTQDPQAIIWKMNELHHIDKMCNENCPRKILLDFKPQYDPGTAGDRGSVERRT